MVLVYGSLSVALFFVGQSVFSASSEDNARKALVRQAQQSALADERRASEFNACLKKAETNTRKVDACKRAYRP
jgi:hypothetical protein